ncbi:hypothetical protein TK50_13825 [Micromonospora haikouensis]|uniref:Uncharacterized protein n=1 Tax=Micromonospora haikouensis TaxID=686309 RepID=A0A0D0W083_9ACTN|nr:hypothetical protein TK50_13825 [Micromonospora haikouensis]
MVAGGVVVGGGGEGLVGGEGGGGVGVGVGGGAGGQVGSVFDTPPWVRVTVGSTTVESPPVGR